MNGVNGLILAGGASSRMGQPKALLTYEGSLQLHRVKQLLQPICSQLFLSCQAPQVDLYRASGWEGPVVVDQARWGTIGPLNGLLSALDRHPGPWLVVGCDYPLLETADIQLLLDSRAAGQLAVAYETRNGLEPIISLYEAAAAPFLISFWEKGQQSLRHFLSSHPIQRVPPPLPDRLQSIDTPEAYHRIHLT